jgi:nucleotidyltransferase/DNA polymerase involved in DNA repair
MDQMDHVSSKARGGQPVPTLHHGGSFRKYMENKNNKLHEQFTAQATGSRLSNLFQGITIHVNGLTNPSHAELRQLMAQHGGRFVNYFSRSTVTHVICSSLTDAKIKIHQRERVPTPIVRPEWVVDSIKAGQLLPINEYALAQLRDAPGQTRLLAFGQTSSNPQGIEASLAQAKEIAAQMRNECDVLKGPPRSSKDDPNFVESYYRASRLHFIGRWKARLEALMASPVAFSAPAASKNKEQTRAIIHIDMDCFFASVAEAGHPEFRGKPLVVSHSNSARGTGEVSSANYVARQYGITASMFISKAKELCPDLIVVPYEFSKYEVISEQVYRIMLKYTASVQPVSCDEAFMDVTGLGDPEHLASQIRKDIVQTTDCTASAGIGPNMLLARLATKRAKPNGQFMLTKSTADPFLLELKVSDLPGVGWSTDRRLKELGIERVADLRARSKEYLQRELGEKSGTLLWEFAHGHDSRMVEVPKGRKSVGAEVNWGIRFEKEKDPEDFLSNLAKEVEQRLNQSGVKGRTITIKLKRKKQGWKEPAKFLGCGHCDNLSRSITLARCVSSKEDLVREGISLLRALQVPFEDIRGIGLSVSKLQEVKPVVKSNPTLNESVLREQSRLEAVITTSPASSCGWEDSDGQSEGKGGHGDVDVNVDGQDNETIQNIPPKNFAGKSLTQIDADELAALPWHVQREIIDTLPRSRNKTCRAGKEEKREGTIDNGDEKGVDPLPSFSQVDTSVLQALPVVVRRELEVAWGINSQAKRVKLSHKSNTIGGKTVNFSKTKTVSNRTCAGEKRMQKIDGYMLEAGRQRHAGQQTLGKPKAQNTRLHNQARITMSQIDPSVLEELPATLQKEVLADIRGTALPSNKIFVDNDTNVNHTKRRLMHTRKEEQADELIEQMKLVLEDEQERMPGELVSLANSVSLESDATHRNVVQIDSLMDAAVKAFDTFCRKSNDNDQACQQSALAVVCAVVVIVGSRLIQLDLVKLRSFLRRLKSLASKYSLRAEELVNDAVERLQQRMIDQYGCRLALCSPLDEI